MTKRTSLRIAMAALSLAAVVAVTLVAALPAAARGGRRDGLDPLRVATGRYFDLPTARADGYALLKDSAGIACIDSPGVGAMGVHYANGTLLEAGVIDMAHPQALVYAPQPDGTLRLSGVEYVVLQSAWDAAHSAPPVLFGESFMLTPVGNRYGLPAFYSMHAWAWERNPRGMFSMWNPHVNCSVTATEPYN